MMEQESNDVVSSSPTATGKGQGRAGVATLDALIHHCAAALRIAESRGDKFLCYMLSMTLQAARQRQPSTVSTDEQVGEPVGL